MIPQEFLKLQGEKIFRRPVMDSIINEFVPAKDALKIQKAFFPYKEVGTDEIIALVQAAGYGMTNPVELNGDHARIGIPTYKYSESEVGHWRESGVWGEKELLEIKDPEKPDMPWGAKMMGATLNMLDLRINVLQEYTSAQVMLNKTFSVAKNGVNYTYDPGIPNKYYVYVGLATSTPSGFVHVPWGADSANRRWSQLATATPLKDIRELSNYCRQRLGLEPVELWMSPTVAGYIDDNTAEVQGWVEANPQMAGKMVTTELLVQGIAGLKGLGVEVDERRYLIETGLRVAATAAAGATFQVLDASDIAVNDIAILRNRTGGEEDVTVTAVSVANRTVTTTTTFANNYAIGDRLTVSKPFFEENSVALRVRTDPRSARARWISTPSLVKAKTWKRGVPGRYTWTFFDGSVPYKVEIGAGIDGGPVVHGGGGWVILRVV